MASTNPLPDRLKGLRGTLKKCRVNDQPIITSQITKIPAPPRWLSKVQKKIYKETCNHLVFLNVLEVTGLPLIVAYSIEYGKYLEASEKMGTEFTLSIETQKGIIKTTNPIQRVIDSSLSNAMKISSLFGLDPVNKSKLKINDDKQEVDGLDEFI
jgi:P27 family predicted phage terminase small subunit